MSSNKKIIKIKKSKTKINTEINTELKTEINNTNNIVSPKQWVLPNKKNFIEFINSTFIKYKNNQKKEETIPVYLNHSNIKDF